MKQHIFGFLFHSLCVLILFSNAVKSQNTIQLENWQTHSSLLNSVDGDIDSQGRIWIATNGGVYNYNPVNKHFEEFRNIDALLSLDVTCVAANRSKKEIFLGTFDGIIEIVNEDYEWTHITDIQASNYPDAKINDIVFKNDTAYICGGFGLTTFDINERVFLQTPARLGSFQPLTTVNQIIIDNNNKLWVATDEGVAVADLSNSIINPGNWRNYTRANGIPEKKVKGIINFNNEIYCFTDTTISKFIDTAFVKIKSTVVWNTIQSLTVYNNKLTYTTLFNIRDIDENLIYSIDQVIDTAKINTAFVNSIDGKMNILLVDAGFVIDGNHILHIKPESPASNLFIDLDIDSNGNLWCATDYSSGKGFMRLKQGKWINFNTKSNPEILTDSYGNVSCFPDGRIVFSSWGVGYLTLMPKNDDEYDFTLTNSSNSCLTGVNGAPKYVVTGAAAFDSRKSSTWIINFAPNFYGNLIMGQNAIGEFHCSVSRSTREFVPLVIDFSGTKWAGSTNGYGLVYFNEGNDFQNPDDDKQGNYSKSNSQLPSNNINNLVVDKTDVIWVATPNGLAYILSPSAVLRDANPIIKPTSLRILASIPINAIMVDALNNKWIATNDGVYALDPDGGVELAHFTTENSPLITNEVISLATDPNSGRIWFGTRKGLSEAQSFAIQPLPSYDITCYPQPYNPERDGNLTIEGLAKSTDLRITTVDGKLMRVLQTTSQKIVWDGRDKYGNYIPSGIYLIMGTSLTSDAKGVVKCAVVRN
jgi:ligand-binding sensor domain-containing protein